MQPHYSQSSRENVPPFNSTSPLASYKEVPPPPDWDKVNYIGIKLHTSVILGEMHLTPPFTPSIVEVVEGKPM